MARADGAAKMTQETMGMAGGVRSPVLILSVAQALYLSTLSVIFTFSGLVGVALAPMASLATLPLALSTVVTAATTIPASILLARIGRRAGFHLGAFIGAVGAGLAAWCELGRSSSWERWCAL